MTGRRLRMSGETAELVRTLHPDLKRKIKAAFQTVLDDPESGKALKDELERMRSFRVGKFRVVYKTTEGKKLIEIVAVGPRNKIYEETLRLLKKEEQ